MWTPKQNNPSLPTENIEESDQRYKLTVMMKQDRPGPGGEKDR